MDNRHPNCLSDRQISYVSDRQLSCDRQRSCDRQLSCERQVPCERQLFKGEVEFDRQQFESPYATTDILGQQYKQNKVHTGVQ